MDRLDMQTKDLVNENFIKLKELFPNAITESIDDEGKLVRAINKDVLIQEINTYVVDGRQERYQLVWPDKNKTIITSNASITNTLRPCREESLYFDTTNNIYIEGDNLAVLKVLRETLLGKIKCIYIDPPYNTGKDFIYRDNFNQRTNDYYENSGQVDELQNILITNTESNGRYHTDWLNMMYSRLNISRNLLTNDGVILISIDDNEQHNLRKICDEIFGEYNFIAKFIRKTKTMTGDDGNGLNIQHEYLYAYAKDKRHSFFRGEEKTFKGYSNPDNDPRGAWISGDPSAKSGGETTYFPICNPITGQIDYPPKGRFWAFSKATMQKYIKDGRIKFREDKKSNQRGFIFKRYEKQVEEKFMPVDSLYFVDSRYMNSVGTNEVNELLGEGIFNYPKPAEFIKKLCQYTTDKASVVLDFFSGSSTTAHAVMQLNAEDGGNRKFIMVQLPEETDEKSEAYKSGYKYITDIGKERIRRAGKKILEENKDKEGIEKLDVGFRVLKLDSSNMKDIYYTPQDTQQSMLEDLTDNIKEDRSELDLLFQVMLDLGVELSSKIDEIEISGKKIYSVADNYLLATFDKDIDDKTITEIAKKKPVFFVMRDASLTSDSVATNFEQIFNTYSPETTRRVL